MAAGLPVHALSIRSMADLDEQLPVLAAAVGVAGAWEPLAVSATAITRRAFVPIWRRPWMALGEDTYGASLLAALGIAVQPAGAGRYPAVELTELVDVDVVLVPSEPYAFKDAHVEELAAIAPPLRIDGQDLLWWGARTPGALRRLGEQLAVP